jgi:hypothetical protein
MWLLGPVGTRSHYNSNILSITWYCSKVTITVWLPYSKKYSLIKADIPHKCVTSALHRGFHKPAWVIHCSSNRNSVCWHSQRDERLAHQTISLKRTSWSVFELLMNYELRTEGHPSNFIRSCSCCTSCIFYRWNLRSPCRIQQKHLSERLKAAGWHLAERVGLLIIASLILPTFSIMRTDSELPKIWSQMLLVFWKFSTHFNITLQQGIPLLLSTGNSCLWVCTTDVLQ